MTSGETDAVTDTDEDTLLEGLIPQAAEHLAEQHAQDYNSEVGRARFLTWLTAESGAAHCLDVGP